MLRDGVLAHKLDCDIAISEFELKSSYSVHFWTNTLGKGMNPLILHSNCVFISTTAALLRICLWHEITHEDWYAIKQWNQTGFTD